MKSHQRLPMSTHKPTQRMYGEKGNIVGMKMYRFHIFSNFFQFDSPFSQRTHCNTAGREFNNPRQVGYATNKWSRWDQESHKYPDLEARLAFCAHMARAAKRRSTEVKLHKAVKIKTDVALRNSELAVHSTLVQSLDPLESHRVFHVEICSSYEKMWSESLQMERE